MRTPVWTVTAPASPGISDVFLGGKIEHTQYDSVHERVCVRESRLAATLRRAGQSASAKLRRSCPLPTKCHTSDTAMRTSATTPVISQLESKPLTAGCRNDWALPMPGQRIAMTPATSNTKRTFYESILDMSRRLRTRRCYGQYAYDHREPRSMAYHLYAVGEEDMD